MQTLRHTIKIHQTKIHKTYQNINKTILQDTVAHNHKEKGKSLRSHIGYIHDTCMKIRWAVRKVTSKCTPQDFDFVEITTRSVCRMRTMTAMTLKRGLQRLLHSASFLVAARRGLPPCQTVHRKNRWSAKSMFQLAHCAVACVFSDLPVSLQL